MDIISTEINNGGHRIFYQTLMTMTFSLNTGHQHHYILKLMIYIIIHLWMLLVGNKNFITNVHLLQIINFI